MQIDKKDETKDLPAIETVAADPRAKIIEELGQDLDEAQTIGLVLDSSGSMGQMLEKNKTKMFYMKKLMKGFISKQWKLKNTLGVRVYGSRKKHQCDDIQLTIPYTDRALSKLELSLEKMEPLGMTPLHKSIEETVDEIKEKKGPKKIVIVTDGEDTCGGDPCKTAEKVKKDKLEITFYVVALGFMGASDELKKLSCLGDVHAADDEESFSDALSEISKKLGQQQQNLKVISPNPDAPVYLYRLVDKKRIFDRVFYARNPQTVDPGTYEVLVGLNPVYKFDAFNILPKRKVTLRVEGEGEVIANYFGEHLRVQILDKNNKVALKFKSDQKVMVPIGKWKLRVYKEPFYERIIPDFYVYPNGKHAVDITGVGVFKVTSPEVAGLYVYDQDNALIDHALTNSILAIKSGTYVVHQSELCSFSKVQVKDKKELLVLPCPEQ